MIVIGILCLVVGAVTNNSDAAFFATAEQHTATITKYIPDPNPKTGDFCPVFEFTTNAGQQISYVGDACPSEPDPSKIGQHEQIYIDPKHPTEVRSNGWPGGDVILGAIGCVVFSSIGLLRFFLTRNRKKE